MKKTKTCYYCGKEVPKLWRSKPPTCAYCAKSAPKQESSKTKQTKTSPKKKKPISPISEKKSKEYVLYRKLRDEFMKDKNMCEICGKRPATDLHHKVSRRYALCDTSIFMATCRYCNDRCEWDDSWARENGYKLSIHDYKK